MRAHEKLQLTTSTVSTAVYPSRYAGSNLHLRTSSGFTNSKHRKIISPKLPFAPRATRTRLGLDQDREIVLVLAGGGGEGTPTAPLTLGARAEPASLWVTVGSVRSEWHETPPGNLDHRGWVDNPRDWIAAADRVVSSCGNTTVHQLLTAGKPWIVVPEWRYFDEQRCKAEVLGREGLAAVSDHWPSHTAAWKRLWDTARRIDPKRQRALIEPQAACDAASWLDQLARRLWDGAASTVSLEAAA